MSKVWFITGASKGFGREWAEAALERGDRVAATARKPETLDALVEQYGDDVLPLQLDVTDRDAGQAAVKQAAEHFGQLDIVVNNAGYGHFGMVEELTEEELRAQLETNLFGAVWVTQAAIPIMREQGSGHIIQVSSIGGISAFPTVGAYHASKWALEGLSQSLAQEVAGFGIHVTLIEPGGFSTDWSGPSAAHSDENSAYDEVREKAKNRPSASSPGDPTATRGPILKVVDADPPPLRVFFGKAPLEIATKDYESRLETWNEWQPVALEAHGDGDSGSDDESDGDEPAEKGAAYTNGDDESADQQEEPGSESGSGSDDDSEESDEDSQEDSGDSGGHGLVVNTVASSDSGRPVVLIHGWPLSSDSWSEQTSALKDAGYRVVTYDRRGFGKSDPGESYDYDALADDLDNVLSDLDLTDVTLVGFSMGGGEVARYVARHGEDRLHSVVFAAAVPPYLLQSDDNPNGPLTKDAAKEMREALEEDRDAFFDDFTKQFFSVEDDLKVSDDQLQEALAMCKKSDQTAALECMDSWATTDFRSDLEKITVPTLVIHGDSDGTVPFEGSGKRTHEAIEGSKLVLIEDAPHGLNVSHAEEFNSALLDFLGD